MGGFRGDGSFRQAGIVLRGLNVRSHGIRTERIGVAQPHELRAGAAMQQVHVAEVSPGHVVDQLADIPLRAGRERRWSSQVERGPGAVA